MQSSTYLFNGENPNSGRGRGRFDGEIMLSMRLATIESSLSVTNPESVSFSGLGCVKSLSLIFNKLLSLNKNAMNWK